jgi:hypothetical protein
MLWWVSSSSSSPRMPVRRRVSDHGNRPPALGRRDIESFLHRLAYLAATGQISPELRAKICRDVKRVLGRIRALGLTHPDGPAPGLGSDFTLAFGDVPAEPERGEPGRNLPPAIMAQLCAQLPLLEHGPSGREIRVAVELLMDTGRRPEEILRLRLDCLARDPDGAAVLVSCWPARPPRARGRRVGPRPPGPGDHVFSRTTAVCE